MEDNQEWKVYKFGEDFDENYKLAFSIYGEVKSFTKKNPEGRLIKGSLREGYPIISFTKYKPADEKNYASFQEQENIIKALRAEANELKRKIGKKSTSNKEKKDAQKRVTALAKKITSAISKLSKQRQKDLKSRRIYFHLLVHKAIAELFIPNDDPENKRFVIHKNFDKKDNQVKNLAWATHEEVVRRSFNSPNYISYKINGAKRDPSIVAKLTRTEVVLIKRKLQKGEPMSRLAKRFGVSDMQIHRIKTGENWGDVKVSLNEKSDK